MSSRLVKTNLLVSLILLIGFALTAFFSSQAKYRDSLESIEQVSSLTTDGIYYQLSSLLNRPVNIARTMSQDRLLVDFLSHERSHLEDAAYVRTIQDYLAAYQQEYNFTSVFLVSGATGRYYSYRGLDRVLDRENPENAWYYAFLASPHTCSLNVDIDEVAGADNAIVVFVNCKIMDARGDVVGVVGIGLNADALRTILRRYERDYGVKVALLNREGGIEVSAGHSGEQRRDWFTLAGMTAIRQEVLGRQDAVSSVGVWGTSDLEGGQSWYVVSRYMPELSWYLLVAQNTSHILAEMKSQLYKSCLVLALIIGCVLSVITVVIRNFNRNIATVIEQRMALFKTATEQLYDNIYEWNLSRGCCVGRNTRAYFESLGADPNDYDGGLRIIAEKQIREEFREGYCALFNANTVINEYRKGNTRLNYDLMIRTEGGEYHWLRIDAHIFHSPDDDSIHMFTYRKNIDAEKRQEALASCDEMTHCYNKKTTERLIDAALAASPDSLHAFFIFDIDNFKHANDTFGHAFGDLCIRTFAATIRKHFREQDIVGRIGGDEFVAFIPIPDIGWAAEKGRELVRALELDCEDGTARWKISASIGIAIAPRDGTRFMELYRNADAALYQSKQGGKNSYTLRR